MGGEGREKEREEGGERESRGVAPLASGDPPVYTYLLTNLFRQFKKCGVVKKRQWTLRFIH